VWTYRLRVLECSVMKDEVGNVAKGWCSQGGKTREI